MAARIARWEVFVSRVCTAFAAVGCAGAALGIAVDVLPVDDTGGGWEAMKSVVRPPAGASSALCEFTVTAPGGGGFTAGLDDLVLLETGLI